MSRPDFAVPAAPPFGWSSTEFYLALGVLAVMFSVFGLVLFTIKRYKRCPSNRILVVFGRAQRGKPATCLHGGGRFVLPVVEDYAYLSLEPIQIEVPLKDALSIENIRVNVPSVFTVAIGTEQEIMGNAAVRLLGLNTAQVKKQAEDIIFGQLRQVIASMQIEEINRDRETFLHNIQSSVEPELRKIGLILINVNITDITDESGYIEAIGRKAASEAIQRARGDVAEQEKLGEIRVSEAERDQRVQVAEAKKVQDIGIRGAEQQKAVRVAELDKQQQVGEQRAALGRQMEVAEAEREKRISVADAEAAAYAGEAEAQARVAAAQAKLQVEKANAYERAESRKREAEAAVQEVESRAMAQAATAKAERIEAERRAELEAPAKALKAKTIVEAEAEAERQRLEAEGEAAAIFARLEAEARGQYEILARKGEGLRAIIDACGGAQPAFQLLMLEHLDNLAEASAKAISNIKFDKVIVWEGGAGGHNGQTSTASFLQGMSRSLPPMMQVLKDIGGVEMPEYLAKLTPVESNGAVVAGDAAAEAMHSVRRPVPKRGSPVATADEAVELAAAEP